MATAKQATQAPQPEEGEFINSVLDDTATRSTRSNGRPAMR